MRRVIVTALALAGLAGAAPKSQAPLEAVGVTRVTRPGVTVKGTPAAYNVSITVRYARTAKPRTILVLMPGFLGGAVSFDRLARQIVTLDPTVAVWAVDRRSNALEAQQAVAKADRATLARISRDGLPARNTSSLAFMQDWGLDVTLRDWRAAVLEARKLTPNVFIGGHSLGAAMAGLYAAYDFDGRAGARDVRGIVMLDGVPGSSLGRQISEAEYDGGYTLSFARATGRRDLASNPFVSLDFYNPVRAARGAAQARLAALDPNGVSPSGLTRYPATNLAAAMLQLEKRYAVLPFLSVTTGRASNVRESYLLPALLVGGARGAEARDAFNVLDPSKPAGWTQDPGAPTDARDFVGRFWRPYGDFVEWYFPQRLTLDMSACGLDSSKLNWLRGVRLWHTAEVNVPMLGVVAQNGIASEDEFRAYAKRTRAPLTTFVASGYAHLDVVTARSDLVARRVLGWMRSALDPDLGGLPAPTDVNAVGGE
ncbi:alpha/beta fold hydrolase [Deinococcus pimensis]|uniref:alpha/beta fold hydrolase n=1 Tax=Deinococcus pimensis TaxID=309888 RepID=UPI0004B78D73|nr:alpha/beta fold hydrolase [Deinococcus pimensis]